MELTFYPQQAYRVPIYVINIRKKNNMIIYPVYIPSNGAGGIASLIDAVPICCYILYYSIIVIRLLKTIGINASKNRGALNTNPYSLENSITEQVVSKIQVVFAE